MRPGWDRPMAGAPNFTLAELCRSEMAEAYRLDNTPNPEHIANLQRLARRLLQPVRDRFGPLRVTSGFRGPELNWYVSLSRSSRHCRGEAADVKPLRAGLWPVAAFVHRELDYQELIVEEPPGGWLHLSLAGDGPQARRLSIREAGLAMRPLAPAELMARSGLA